MKNLILLFLFCSISFAQNKSVEFYKINDSTFIHTTYKIYNGFNTPSNGLISITSKGIVLIDTPWDDEQTSALIDSCKNKFNKEIILALITHYHDDRIGGIKTLLKNDVKVFSSKLTADKATEFNFPRPKEIFANDTTFQIAKSNFEFYFPGAGHTIDNTVIYLPQSKILFGGCLVKSMQSNSKGNITDADLKAWPNSLKNLLAKFDDAKIVIPGHGNYGGKELIEHSIKIVESN